MMCSCLFSLLHTVALCLPSSPLVGVYSNDLAYLSYTFGKILVSVFRLSRAVFQAASASESAQPLWVTAAGESYP